MSNGTALLFAIGSISLAACSVSRSADPPPFPVLPESSSSLGAVACDGWLYVFGGHTGKTHEYSTESVSGKFRRIRLDGGTKWEELPGGPGLQGMNLAAAHGKIYRVGGMQPRNAPGEPSDNVSVAAAMKFDPATKQWSALPDLPEPRSSHDVVALDDQLYVVGGWNMRGRDQPTMWPKSAYVLDLQQPGAKWQSIAQPFQRRALTAAAANHKLYVIGGFTEESDTAESVNIFDPKTGQWTDGPPIPGDGVGFAPAACESGGRVFVSTSKGRVYSLNAAGDQWVEVGEMKVPRMVHRMVPLRADALIAVGGASHKGDARIVEVIPLKLTR
jgi:N-acetylneuraminic acid mutarotase